MTPASSHRTDVARREVRQAKCSEPWCSPLRAPLPELGDVDLTPARFRPLVLCGVGREGLTRLPLEAQHPDRWPRSDATRRLGPHIDRAVEERRPRLLDLA